MRILHVVHQFAPETWGGVESHVADLMAEQRRQGHEPVLVTGSHVQWAEPGIEEGAHEGVPVFRMHREDLYFDHHAKAWHPGVGALFEGLLERLRPDVVHVHHWIRLTSDLVARCADRAVPAVVSLHDVYASCPRAFRVRPGDSACMRPLSEASCRDCVPRYGHETPGEIDEGIALFRDGYRAELARAAAVLVGGEAVAGLIGDKLGVPADRFEVLPLGYRRRWDGQPPLDPDPPDGAACRFAFWGGVGRHKGVLVLLEAFRRLRDEGVAAELHVLGGFESPDFEREVRAAAEGTGAVFHGPFDAASLRAAHPHCGVFPSTCIETHGIVLDECYELGLPAVVSDLGALGVRVGGGGIAVPPGDAAALARAMAEVATDPERRRALIAGRPALPPDGAEYARRVASVYGHVTGVRPADTTGAGVPLARRLAFLQRQRESAYRQPVPPGGPK